VGAESIKREFSSFLHHLISLLMELIALAFEERGSKDA